MTKIAAESITAAMTKFSRANDAKLSALLAGGWDAVAYEGQPLWTIADVVVEYPGYYPMTAVGVVMDFGHMPLDLLAALTADGCEPSYYTRSETALTPVSYRQVCDRQRALMAA